jgi:hypothetical protein
MATKTFKTTHFFFFFPLLVLLLLDPAGIRYQKSGIRCENTGNHDSRSGINIPDSQHCEEDCLGSAKRFGQSLRTGIS